MDFDLLNRAVVLTFGEETIVEWLDAVRDLNGIFDSRHYELESEGDVAVSERVTTLAVVEDPGLPIAIGERLTARETTWRVKDKRPDGQGMTVLELELA